MRGLTLLIPTPDRVRFRAALSLACAQGALGGRVRVFCQEEAMSLLIDRPDPDATQLQRVGLPDIPTLIEAARNCGVAFIVCQTGLAAAKLEMTALVPGVEAGGMVGILATLDDDRLISG
jgi:predicted peroxiredoxin